MGFLDKLFGRNKKRKKPSIRPASKVKMTSIEVMPGKEYKFYIESFFRTEDVKTQDQILRYVRTSFPEKSLEDFLWSVIQNGIKHVKFPSIQIPSKDRGPNYAPNKFEKVYSPLNDDDLFTTYEAHWKILGVNEWYLYSHIHQLILSQAFLPQFGKVVEASILINNGNLEFSKTHVLDPCLIYWGVLKANGLLEMVTELIRKYPQLEPWESSLLQANEAIKIAPKIRDILASYQPLERKELNKLIKKEIELKNSKSILRTIAAMENLRIIRKDKQDEKTVFVLTDFA